MGRPEARMERVAMTCAVGIYPMLDFDLATPANLAFLQPSPSLCFHRVKATDRRSEFLFPAIESLLEESGTSMSGLRSIGVGRGPGSFTGVRNAVMAAKALAFALEIPLYAPSTLDALAWGAGGSGLVATLIDARRGEVYACVYRRWEEGLTRLTPPEVLSPETARERIKSAALSFPGDALAVVGTGAHAYPETFSTLGDMLEDPFPSPGGLLSACLEESRLRGSVDPLGLQPLYIRRPDAECGRPWGPEYSAGNEG